MRAPGRKRIVVLGAGPTGLAVAHFLASSPVAPAVDLVEAEEEPGGAHRSFEWQGHVFDHGSFVYPDRPGTPLSLPRLFHELFAEPDSFRTALLLDGRQHPWPLPARSVLGRMTGRERLLLAPRYAASRLELLWRGDTCADLETWLRLRLGPDVLRSSGLREYMAKLMGLPLAEIDASFGEKRLCELAGAASPAGLVRALGRKVLRTAEPASLAGRYTRLLYPVRGGAGSIAHHWSAALAGRGVRMHLGCRVQRIEHHAGGVDCTASSPGGVLRLEADALVATIPVPALASLLGLGSRFEGLRYRRLLLLFLVADTPHALGGLAVLYSFEPRHPWKRITCYSELRATPASARQSALGIEIPDPGLPSGQHHRYVDDLVGEIPALQGSVVSFREMDSAYPVLRIGYRGIREAFLASLQGTRIVSAGRSGGFDYADSYDCLEQGRDAANAVLAILRGRPAQGSVPSG